MLNKLTNKGESKITTRNQYQIYLNVSNLLYVLEFRERG